MVQPNARRDSAAITMRNKPDIWMHKLKFGIFFFEQAEAQQHGKEPAIPNSINVRRTPASVFPTRGGVRQRKQPPRRRVRKEGLISRRGRQGSAERASGSERVRGRSYGDCRLKSNPAPFYWGLPAGRGGWRHAGV